MIVGRIHSINVTYIELDEELPRTRLADPLPRAPAAQTVPVRRALEAFALIEKRRSGGLRVWDHGRSATLHCPNRKSRAAPRHASITSGRCRPDRVANVLDLVRYLRHSDSRAADFIRSQPYRHIARSA